MASLLLANAIGLALSCGHLIDEPIVTDRPDFTESSTVVQKGRIQFESGVTFLRESGSRFTSGPEGLVRIGMGSKLELRVGAPDYANVEQGGMRQTGFGDASLGVKLEFPPCGNGVQTAMIAAISLPTGASGFSSNSVDPELAWLASADLAAGGSIAGMAHVAFPKLGNRRVTAFTGTLSYAMDIGSKLGSFFELAGSSMQGESTSWLFHLGLTHQPRPSSQWDVHAAFGLNRAAPDFLIGAGYSVRY